MKPRYIVHDVARYNTHRWPDGGWTLEAFREWAKTQYCLVCIETGRVVSQHGTPLEAEEALKALSA